MAFYDCPQLSETFQCSDGVGNDKGCTSICRKKEEVHGKGLVCSQRSYLLQPWVCGHSTWKLTKILSHPSISCGLVVEGHRSWHFGDFALLWGRVATLRDPKNGTEVPFP